MGVGVSYGVTGRIKGYAANKATVDALIARLEDIVGGDGVVELNGEEFHFSFGGEIASGDCEEIENVLREMGDYFPEPVLVSHFCDEDREDQSFAIGADKDAALRLEAAHALRLARTILQGVSLPSGAREDFERVFSRTMAALKTEEEVGRLKIEIQEEGSMAPGS